MYLPHAISLTVSISNDRSETGFELSAEKWSIVLVTCTVASENPIFNHFNRKGANQATLSL
jgi:hypothetical protein